MKRFKLGKSHMNVNSMTSVFSLKGYLRGVSVHKTSTRHDPLSTTKPLLVLYL